MEHPTEAKEQPTANNGSSDSGSSSGKRKLQDAGDRGVLSQPAKAGKQRKTTKKLPKQQRVGNFRSYLLGVDVDPQLISRARTNLKEILQQQQIERAFGEIPAVKPVVTTSSNAKTSFGGSSSAAASPADVSGEVAATNPRISSAGDKQPTAQDTGGVSGKSSDGDAFANDMPLSFKLWKPPIHTHNAVPRAIGRATIGTAFPLNVIFKREDIVTDSHAGKDYDFITCFSVTKWIHLFHGDEGIKKVFAKIYELLAPAGRFILEPQPWKSYHKRKFTSEVTAANYPKIQLRPKDFQAFLVDTVGFRTCEFLEVCQTSAKGFRRPIYVAQK
ncbi:hypothetical protein BBJ28_00024750 [Nothophytophthora sp. Chile5]|nr:hypothetical protein BBJ28_00024750 [Nothophytophthora sp. Chile5]